MRAESVHVIKLGQYLAGFLGVGAASVTYKVGDTAVYLFFHHIPSFEFHSFSFSWCSGHFLLSSTNFFMVAPRCMTERSQAQPAQPSARCVTRKANATAHPGLPDKPALRRTSEQKRVDEEQIRQAKEAQKIAKQDTYQRISTLQAQMVIDQSEARKDRAGLRPKPRVVRKQVGQEEKEVVVLPPCYPCQSHHLYIQTFKLLTSRHIRGRGCQQQGA